MNRNTEKRSLEEGFFYDKKEGQDQADEFRIKIIFDPASDAEEGPGLDIHIYEDMHRKKSDELLLQSPALKKDISRICQKDQRKWVNHEALLSSGFPKKLCIHRSALR